MGEMREATDELGIRVSKFITKLSLAAMKMWMRTVIEDAAKFFREMWSLSSGTRQACQFASHDGWGRNSDAGGNEMQIHVLWVLWGTDAITDPCRSKATQGNWILSPNGKNIENCSSCVCMYNSQRLPI